MSTINAGAWPKGRVATRHQMPDGRIVEVTTDWDEVYWLARRALGNKTQRSTSGPVRIKVLKP